MGLELKGKHSEMMLSLLQSWTLRDENGIDGDDLKLVIHSDYRQRARNTQFIWMK